MELILWLILATLVAGLSYICFYLNVLEGQLYYMIKTDPALRYKEPELRNPLPPGMKEPFLDR
jgi:hypothetical protein